jgi:hypothetical protein
MSAQDRLGGSWSPVVSAWTSTYFGAPENNRDRVTSGIAVVLAPFPPCSVTTGSREYHTAGLLPSRTSAQVPPSCRWATCSVPGWSARFSMFKVIPMPSSTSARTAVPLTSEPRLEEKPMVALKVSEETVPSLPAGPEVVSSSSPVSSSPDEVPPQPPSTRIRIATSNCFGTVLSALETGVMRYTILTKGASILRNLLVVYFFGPRRPPGADTSYQRTRSSTRTAQRDSQGSHRLRAAATNRVAGCLGRPGCPLDLPRICRPAGHAHQ